MSTLPDLTEEPRRSFFPFARKQQLPIDEVVDQQLDSALERLANAFQANDEMCERVRRRQSSGSLKLAVVPADFCAD